MGGTIHSSGSTGGPHRASEQKPTDQKGVEALQATDLFSSEIAPPTDDNHTPMVASYCYYGQTNDKGERHGQGTTFFDVKKTQKLYEGNFKNDVRHGEGTSYYKDLDGTGPHIEYEGNWAGGSFFGKGTLYCRDKTLSGTFNKEGVLHRTVTITPINKDGTTGVPYTEKWQNGEVFTGRQDRPSYHKNKKNSIRIYW